MDLYLNINKSNNNNTLIYKTYDVKQNTKTNL